MPVIGGKPLKVGLAGPVDIFFAEVPNGSDGFLTPGILSGAVPTDEKVPGPGQPNRLPYLLKGI